MIETTPEACRATYLDRHSSIVPQCGIIFYNCTYLLKTRCPVYIRDMQMYSDAITQYFPQLSVSFSVDDGFLTTLHYLLSREKAKSYIVITTSSEGKMFWLHYSMVSCHDNISIRPGRVSNISFGFNQWAVLWLLNQC